MTDQFTWQIPHDPKEDPSFGEWRRNVTLLLDQLTRQDGVVSTVESTADTVVTQGEKLAFITVTQAVNLDTLETAVEKIATSSPDYTISNDGTVRTLNADDAAGAISASPTQAEVENLRDAILTLADVVATMNRDLQGKDILG